jgi:hypothetical protein
MSRVIERTGLAGALLSALVFAGCAAPTPQSRASATQQVACQQHADQAFQIQNRGAKYAADAYVSGSRDTPFSATGASGDTTSGLGARYSRDNLYSNCINGIGPPLGGAPTAATPPQPVLPPPP